MYRESSASYKYHLTDWSVGIITITMITNACNAHIMQIMHTLTCFRGVARPLAYTQSYWLKVHPKFLVKSTNTVTAIANAHINIHVSEQFLDLLRTQVPKVTSGNPPMLYNSRCRWYFPAVAVFISSSGSYLLHFSGEKCWAFQGCSSDPVLGPKWLQHRQECEQQLPPFLVAAPLWNSARNHFGNGWGPSHTALPIYMYWFTLICAGSILVSTLLFILTCVYSAVHFDLCLLCCSFWLVFTLLSCIPRDERICTICNSGEVGDEFHYLLNCSNENVKRNHTKHVDK